MNQLHALLAQISIDESTLNIPKADLDDTSVASIFELAFGVLGSVAFIIVVISGIKFIMSRGNPEKIASARNTIVYAGVGLVICVSAFALVRFVVRNV